MIKLQNISKSYTDNHTFVVKKFSLHVHRGETLVLLGSSGSGKTTVLKMINRLIEPTQGTIEVNGQNIKQQDPIVLRRSIGYVFQHTNLFPHFTVEENISIVLRLMGVSAKRRRQRAEELLILAGLAPQDYLSRYPAQLSGGQQQRVGVARALAADPHCLLMDEPFGALDAMTRAILQEEILRLKKTLNKTIVFVTHDINEAFRLADRIAIMHQGCLEQLGTKEDLLQRPATSFVENFLNYATSNHD
ncbi:MAG: ATP-binding cassette domain-containing protein [Gammaproteobacteria bacterium]|nr:ATP-binding cassette domain-containing protein [Gammaproteobacteria bacterium]